MSHTFSCALQTVDVDGIPVTFESDPQDYHLCRMRIGDVVVTFNRNGQATGWHREEEPAPDETEAESEPSSEATADQTETPTETEAQTEADPLEASDYRQTRRR